MKIVDLFQYSDNARCLLHETLAASPAVFDKPLIAPLEEFNSIRQILVHMVGAEERWVEMRIGGREIEFYRDRAPEELDAIYADWDRNRARTWEFLKNLSENDLNRVYKVTLGGWTGELTVEHILFHLINHETHHRGQISMALQQFGIDPPDFDFIFLKAQ